MESIMGGGGPSAAKKMPLLSLTSSQPKRKKEPKAFVFELELGESNDKTYPEFSWAALVRDAKSKELEEKKKQGGSLLDPFASDDEDDLKAMAARLEEKYASYEGSSGKQTKKRKKGVFEDCVDRGAGYDENDSFIDNTDAYDEQVPRELQPVYGGFYINSGKLDFKEVAVSEDEEEELKDREAVKKLNAAVPTVKKVPAEGAVTIKKRKLLQDPLARPKGSGKVVKLKSVQYPPSVNSNPGSAEPPKKKARQISSSSSSDSSSSGSSSSSSSDSDDSSSCSSGAEQTKKKKDPDIIVLHSKTPPPVPTKKPIIVQKKVGDNTMGSANSNRVSIKPTIIPKRPRVKNVPLNPNLKRREGETPRLLPLKSANLPPATITPKKIIHPKEFMKGKSNTELSKVKAVPGLNCVMKVPSSSPSPVSSRSSPSLTPSSSPSTSTTVKTSTPTSVIRVPSKSPVATPTSSYTKPGTSPNISTTASPTNAPAPQTLSISDELIEIFPVPNESTSGSSLQQTASAASSRTPNQTFQKPGSFAESLQILKAVSSASTSVVSSPKVSPSSNVGIAEKGLPKPLPKLKHKSGIVIEKQTHSPSPPPSSKPQQIKINPKHTMPPIGTSSSPVITSFNPTLTSTPTSSKSFHQTLSSNFGSVGAIEITKLRKNLPGLGSGITVTEVADKGPKPGGSTGGSLFAGTPHLKISAGHGSTPPPSQPSSSQGYASVLNNLHSASSLASTLTLTSNHQKTQHSVTISPSPLIDLTRDSPDRQISPVVTNKQTQPKLPGYITPYDVSALLSSSKKMPEGKGNSDFTGVSGSNLSFERK